MSLRDELLKQLPYFAHKQLARITSFYSSSSTGRVSEDNPAKLEDCNIITSAVDGVDDTHIIMLDIDFPIWITESSTPGHFHLYMNKAMSWADYQKLLKGLAALGIIEPGYAKASIARGYTALRPPWVLKFKKEQTS